MKEREKRLEAYLTHLNPYFDNLRGNWTHLGAQCNTRTIYETAEHTGGITTSLWTDESIVQRMIMRIIYYIVRIYVLIKMKGSLDTKKTLLVARVPAASF